ncbi:MAG: hypothetical protein V5A56_16350 [Halolamina sp.]
MSESQSEVGELVTRLQRRASAHKEACKRVEEAGEDRLLELQEHYEEITGLMGRYESRIVSDGDGEVDMEAFIEYQEEIAHFIEHLPEDIDHRDAFEEVDEIMHERYLKTTDFETARTALSAVADLVERLDERERTRKRYEEARRDVAARKRELDERIDEYERLVELGEADLDAPIERLRESIKAYDDAVTEAFESFKREASAREVLSFVETTAAFPLVEFRRPPADLRDYVDDYAAGEESIAQLLEYADYSKSKLDHYVEHADALKRNVATHRTYLQRLDAEPLTVDWPPPSAGTLRYRCRELVSVVGRFAAEPVVAALREVRALADREDYDRLRDSAVAQDRLDETERERLKRGEVQAELQGLREQREKLIIALEEYEPRDGA